LIFARILGDTYGMAEKDLTLTDQIWFLAIIAVCGMIAIGVVYPGTAKEFVGTYGELLGAIIGVIGAFGVALWAIRVSRSQNRDDVIVISKTKLRRHLKRLEKSAKNVNNYIKQYEKTGTEPDMAKICLTIDLATTETNTHE
jgi:gas vesicle protein